MCDQTHGHEHSHGHEHGHAHEHGHVHHVHLKERILDENERAAARVRESLDGTLVVNLISSPGSGKTTLLEATVERMGKDCRLGAIVGDVATERDANRLQRTGVPALQVLTGGACHLDARQVERVLGFEAFRNLDILFIENVGNLICPTAFDLGEDFKVALLSVTEGDDKPFKYPGIFARAPVTVISKIDLAPHVAFDLDAVRTQIKCLNPDARVLAVSATQGEGVKEWCDLVMERRAAAGAPAGVG